MHESRQTVLVSDACQINDLNAGRRPLLPRAQVSDACQINDLNAVLLTV